MNGRIKKILLESIAKRAYHFTNNAAEIIEENRLHASSAIGSSSDMERNKNKFYFVSLTRSGIDGYNSGRQKIVLDGEKLSQKYSGHPVDYWSIPRDTRSPNGELTIMRTGMEKEDRIILNKPYIENIRKYIIEVHYDLSYFYGNNSEEIYWAKQVKDVCEKYNIPVYFYLNQNDFRLEKKSKRVSLEDIDGFEEMIRKESEKKKGQKDSFDKYEADFDVKKYRMESRLGSLFALLCFNDKRNESIIKKTLYGDENIPWSERVTAEIEKDNMNYLEDERLKSSWSLSEYISTISSDIHNIRTNRDDYAVFILELLRKDMTRLKVRGLKDYVLKKVGLYDWYYRERDENKKKFEFVLTSDYGDVSWNKSVRSYVGESEIADIMRKLPSAKIHEPKTIKLFNDKNLTMRALFNFLVKNVGRKFAEQVFVDDIGLNVEKQDVYV